MQSWWQLFFCLLPCQDPSNIMNVWRQCCGYIWSLFERFGVCGGIRLHSGEAVSHRQCLQNEICLLDFLIPLAVIVLVNSDAFNKGALAFPDSRPSRVSCRSFEEEHRSGLAVQMKCVIFGTSETLIPGFFHVEWISGSSSERHGFDPQWGKSHVRCKVMAANCADSD